MSSGLLILALFVAFWCWGVHNAFLDGEILAGPGKLIRKILPAWARDPLTECTVCMPSIHGTAWFLIFQDWAFFPWILFIVSVSGFNYIISK